jgi:hypothetical protein
MRPSYELAEIITRFGDDFTSACKPNAYVLRVLRAIEYCRTPALGGHVDRCQECGHIRLSYNSCRNRHCPKCQNTQREAWIEDRKQDLLPVSYFHVVFTVPDKLNALFLAHPAPMYNLLFKACWATIAQFFLTRHHTQAGMIAVLHTWGQNLAFHPHIHCIVPGGGTGICHNWKPLKRSASGKAYLFPVKNLSSVFRGKFVESLAKTIPLDSDLIRELYRYEWVVYAKDPFAGPEAVVEYLGRYTHKTAISNHRILNVDAQGVRFLWRDYRDNQQKVMTLEGVEFLRRFCQHILDKGFVRVRHYGFLSASNRPVLRALQQRLGLSPVIQRIKKDWKDICRQHLGFDPERCPVCGNVAMVTIERFLPGRGPPCEYPESSVNNKTSILQ